MRAGNRSHRVTFTRPTVSAQNASGEDAVSNVDLGDAWVNIAALKGNEREAGQQLYAEAHYFITTEHPLASYTLQRKDKILWGSKTLNILDIQDVDHKRRGLRIVAKELAS